MIIAKRKNSLVAFAERLRRALACEGAPRTADCKTTKAKRTPPNWTVTITGTTLTYAAWTKGEARAQFKKEFGPIPAGMKFSKVTGRGVKSLQPAG